MAAGTTRQSLVKPVPRWRVGILYVAALTLGVAPYTWLAQSWKAWLGLLVANAVAFFLANRSRADYAGERPSALEICAGLVGRVAGGASIAMFGVGMYAAIGWVSSFFVSHDSIEFNSSLILIGLFSFAFVYGDAAEFTQALYPSQPGQRSPFLQHVDEKRDVLHFSLRVGGISRRRFGGAPAFLRPRRLPILFRP